MCGVLPYIYQDTVHHSDILLHHPWPLTENILPAILASYSSLPLLDSRLIHHYYSIYCIMIIWNQHVILNSCITEK